jgi:hypothetical protein
LPIADFRLPIRSVFASIHGQNRQSAIINRQCLGLLNWILHDYVIHSQRRRRGALQICQSLAVIGFSLKFICAGGGQLGLSL